ncbi:MAG TPA: CHAT domain-containing tetratricopeptide repeat protein [Bacteroidia bacterium]
MYTYFSRYFLVLVISTLTSLGVKAQSYKQLLKEFDNSLQENNRAKRFEIGSKIKNTCKKELGKDPVRLAEIDNCFGNYYLENNNYDSAQACFARAVNGIYAVKADTSFDYALYLGNMAYTLKQMGYYETADKYYGVALPRLANFLGPSSEEYCMYVKQYVELKVDMGDYTTATTYNEALLYFFKTLKGESNKTYRACLVNKAMILQGQGQYPESVEIHYKSVESARSENPLDTLALATCLNNVAYCYRLMGNHSQAEYYFLEAYELEKQCKSIPLSDQASLLNNLAIVYKAKSDYANAEKCFLKSIDLYNKAGMTYYIEMANPCNNLGDMYRVLGNYKEASNYLSYALEIRKRTSGEEHEYYANALNNIGLLQLEFGLLNDAEVTFKRCEEIYKAKLGEEHDRYSYILNQLSSLYAAKKEYSKALEYKNKALRLMERTIGKKHDRYALFLSGKGRIEAVIKDYKSAINTYTEAADLFAANFGTSNYNYLDMIHSLANVNMWNGNYKAARNLHLKAIYGYKKVINDNLAFMGDEEKAAFYISNSDRFETFETFVVDHFRKFPNEKDDSLLKAFIDERLWTKSILLSESNSLHKTMTESKDTAVVSLYNKWFEQKKYLHQLYQFSKPELEQNNINVADEESYLNNLEKSLTQSSGIFAKQKDFLTFESLKGKLAKNELAVEIVRDVIYVDTVPVVSYAALLVGKDYKAPQLVIFDSTAFFDTLFLDKYKFNIHANKTDRLSYNRFFKPLEKQLNGITKIYFSPDGVYQQLNLYTLFNPQINKYLIETIEVEQVTSLNDLQKENAASTEMSAVLFGFPDYEWKKDPSTGPGSEQLLATRFGFSDLPELPGTKKETELISDVFRNGKWNTKLFLAKEATEEQVKNTVNPTILHIATHGFFLPNMDYKSEKVLGFETETARQNPLLRSGVIMAGAATKDTTIEKKEDGILTAYEASLLNLQNTELVTLSACETGLGDQVVNGQGVYGLQRAFLTAGAKSILMSLWVVDDNATQELMTNFYTEWLKNYSSKTKRAAFRKAQLEVKKRYPNPYYWGAFVMVGR